MAVYDYNGNKIAESKTDVFAILNRLVAENGSLVLYENGVKVVDIALPAVSSSDLLLEAY